MEKITHQGTVVAIKDNSVEVKIINRSACAQCLAHHHCGLEEKKEKIISISTNKSKQYKIGDEVTVSLKTSMGLKAVVFGYVLPLVLLLLTIFILHNCGYSVFISGISSIIVLIPYYFGLFLAKDKLKSLFKFEIENCD